MTTTQLTGRTSAAVGIRNWCGKDALLVIAKAGAGATRLSRMQKSGHSVHCSKRCSRVLNVLRTGAVAVILLMAGSIGCRLAPPGLPDYYGVWTSHPQPGHTLEITFFEDGTGFWTYEGGMGGIPHFHFKYKVNYDTDKPGFHEIDFFDFESTEPGNAIGFLGIVEFTLAGDITKTRFEGVWVPADQRGISPIRPTQFSDKAIVFTRSPRMSWALNQLRREHLAREQKVKELLEGVPR